MNIRKIRKERGMTQEELAMKLNVTRSSVAMWEAERATPSTDKLIKLAKTLDCTIDELLGMEE